MTHGCNPGTQEMEAGRRENLRLARATQDTGILHLKKKKKRKKVKTKNWSCNFSNKVFA